MTGKTTTRPEGRSVAHSSRVLERVLIVAAVASVLVAVGAWIAMNRPADGAAAASAGSSAVSGGTAADAAATDSATDATTDDEAATAAPSSAAPAAGDAAAGSVGSGAGGSSGGSTRSGAAAPSTPTPTSRLSPTTAFLTALAASGMAPPVDDTQKLAMADDVCQELGNGATYDDMVRALVFAGAAEAEAANFARISIANLCPRYEAG